MIRRNGGFVKVRRVPSYAMWPIASVAVASGAPSHVITTSRIACDFARGRRFHVTRWPAMRSREDRYTYGVRSIRLEILWKGRLQNGAQLDNATNSSEPVQNPEAKAVTTRHSSTTD